MSKGYTILELLVVVGIISLISIIAISNFPQAKLQFSLSRVANKFEQDMRRAQDLALSSSRFRDSNGVLHPVKGYGVYTLNSKQYIIYADSLDQSGNNNLQYDPTIDYIAETIDFGTSEPGILIKNFSSQGVHFNPPNPTTSFQPNLGANILTITFAIENDQTKTKTVSIYATGLVEVGQ